MSVVLTLKWMEICYLQSGESRPQNWSAAGSRSYTAESKRITHAQLIAARIAEDPLVIDVFGEDIIFFVGEVAGAQRYRHLARHCPARTRIKHLVIGQRACDGIVGVTLIHVTHAR